MNKLPEYTGQVRNQLKNYSMLEMTYSLMPTNIPVTDCASHIWPPDDLTHTTTRQSAEVRTHMHQVCERNF